MNNYINPNLVKACEIMKILANQPEGILATELESLIQVPKTTAFRILKAMVLRLIIMNFIPMSGVQRRQLEIAMDRLSPRLV